MLLGVAETDEADADSSVVRAEPAKIPKGGSNVPVGINSVPASGGAGPEG
jgi:hypothetical protein